MADKLDDAQVTAWRLFLTSHTTLIEAMERDLARADLPPLRWYDVLYALEAAPKRRLRMHELSRRIVLSRSNLTRLVDRLEVAGLLRREADSLDRRGAFAVLTAEGARMRRRMWPTYGRAIQRHFADHVDDSEIRVLSQVFEHLLSAAQEADSG